MKFFKEVKTSLIALLLAELLIGKTVIMSDGSNIGKVADVRLEPADGRSWVIINNQNTWREIPSEEITGFNDEIVLFNTHVFIQ